MADIGIQIAETLQTASIKHHPSVEHDLNPATAASDKQPVEILDPGFLSASDVDSEQIHSSDDEIPIPIRPIPRRNNIPPLPDLRFEQSYLASIKDAESWQKIAYITVKDQIFTPLVQGMLWTLIVSGWRYSNRATQFNGQNVGARIRRWWWGVNNWKLPNTSPGRVGLGQNLGDRKLAADIEEVSHLIRAEH